MTFEGVLNVLWPLLHIFRGQDPQIPRIYDSGYYTRSLSRTVKVKVLYIYRLLICASSYITS